MQLPKHVRSYVSRGKRFYYWHPFRGTPRAEKAVRIPHDPHSAEFWQMIERLQNGENIHESGIAEMVTAYLASPKFKEKSEATKADYLRYLLEFKQDFGEFEPDDIKPQNMVMHHDSMHLTPVKADHYMSVIRTLYHWGIGRGYCNTNPAEFVERNGVKGDGYKPWPPELYRLAQEHMRDECRIATALALYTGQRRSDVLEMRLQDIKNGKIKLQQRKTGNALSIRIHRDLQPTIDECRKRAHIYLVSKPNGEKFTPDQFTAMWGREFKRCPALSPIKQAGLVFHGLRKSACVHLIEAGCTIAETASVTGQSHAMVSYYSKGVNQEQLNDVATDKWENVKH